MLVVMTGPSIVALACGDKTPVVPKSCCPTTDNTVHAVLVAPAAATIKTGDRLQLDAQVDAGAGVTDRSVLWASSDTARATVSPTGLVTPTGAIGVVTIIATAKADLSIKGTSTITVSAVPPRALVKQR
jgi:uncharacterized protein YjdB